MIRQSAREGTESMARVSIIVRSMDRPELHDALRSIAAQSAPDVEVIVVAASGPGHSPPPSHCGRYPIRYVPGDLPRQRPVAANAGIDAATGAFIGLLDDDDLLLPAHVETLVAALDESPACPAAYAVVREVDSEGHVVQFRARPFSQLLLYQDCYIPPCSLLFRRTALAHCRFDEALDICQDWDFWLQLSELGDFAFVSKETSVFRSSLGTSGTGVAGNRDYDRYRRYRAMLATKWERRGREVSAAVDAAAAHALRLFANGRRNDAETAADRVLASYPYEVTALNLKGTLLAMRNDFDGALAIFRTAAAEAPADAASRFNLAQALERLGRAAEASSEYERILTLVPGHPQAAARKAALAAGNSKQ